MVFSREVAAGNGAKKSALPSMPARALQIAIERFCRPRNGDLIRL
jgi:hypothetical protein